MSTCGFVDAGTIQGHMLQAQLELIEKGCFKGLDAQCVSNLIW